MCVITSVPRRRRTLNGGYGICSYQEVSGWINVGHANTKRVGERVAKKINTVIISAARSDNIYIRFVFIFVTDVHFLSKRDNIILYTSGASACNLLKFDTKHTHIRLLLKYVKQKTILNNMFNGIRSIARKAA